ncbi:MAG: SUMF1/EgtB/PvdO family nonheme iron enzyme [Planctomycetes bacterium]|nr:SUMF1/EgtB/PvdO family nonheme iron enzyme [Planctomycetota bacterium]
MASSSNPLEDLAFDCLERMADEGDSALESVCREHPEHAPALRHLVEQLRRCGLTPGCEPEVQAPVQLGEYRLLRRLGSGGMGIVYLAEQERLRRQVALKLLRPGSLPIPSSRARFRREIEALSRLDHPHICTVYDAGEVDGVPFLAMRHVHGETLAQRVARAQESRTAEPVELLLVLLEKVARALHAAHEAGVVHRDVKPANIMVDERGEPAILDFGLAHDEHASAADLTASSQRLGTPCFMAPEQIAPEIGPIDRRTDVYQLGVTAYLCLTLRLPFDVTTREGTYRAILAGDAPEPRAVAPRIGRELNAVVLRAIAREPTRRFDSAAAFADELERVRTHRPVLTHAPGPVQRLMHWSRRNRVAAVFLATLSAGLLASSWLASTLAERSGEFHMLANVLRLQEARQAERKLDWRSKPADLEHWLQVHGSVLSAELPRVRRLVAELESRAIPRSAAELDADRRAHPRFAEWEARRRELQFLRRVQAVRSGSVPPSLPPVPHELRGKTARELHDLAAPLVDWDDETRTVARAELALAMLRAAVAKLDDGDASIGRPRLLRALAAAQYANGLDADARAAAGEAVRLAEGTEVAVSAAYVADLERRITLARDGAAQAEIDRLERDYRALDDELSRRRSWRFASDAEDYLHRTLRQAVVDIERFEQDELRRVRERLAWARRIDVWTDHHPHAQVSWTEASDAIAKADGVVASELYAAHPIELRPQTGLVPIGMNPVTKLWEFYHLRSAWDPESGIDAVDAIEIPTHGAGGTIDVRDDTGIVFVLLPGGTFWMGAQRDDPALPNHDPGAQPDEILHQVTLEPFFLARHELTRGQWRRLSGRPEPGFFVLGETYMDAPEPIGSTHPVESVGATECDALLDLHGLVLPTEAQWEYGCRATTQSPWWCGSDKRTLVECANLLGTPIRLYDGHDPALDQIRKPIAPVGSYLPNPFGLHDVHGNVFEWCLDRYGSYMLPCRPGDGLREVNFDARRVCRGGGQYETAVEARSARRNPDHSEVAERSHGLRAARRLETVAAVAPDDCMWIARHSGPGPTARFRHAMAYDPVRQRVVLFGGSDGWPEVGPIRVFGDTWEWDGVRWYERRPSVSPEPRERSLSAYDPSRQRTILCDGYGESGEPLTDMWEWDGVRWSLVAPPGSVPAEGMGLVFDASRQQCVLVSPDRSSSVSGRGVQIWYWAVAGWRLESTEDLPWWIVPVESDAPGEGLLLYDPMTGEVLARDGTAWRRRSSETRGPSARGNIALTGGLGRGRFVLFGGGVWTPDSLGAFSDTWEWDGAKWVTRASHTVPPARYCSALVYDAARGRAVMFGGYRWTGPVAGLERDFPLRELFDDTWELVIRAEQPASGSSR